MGFSFKKSVNTRIYSGYSLMVLIMLVSVGLSTFMLNSLREELQEIKTSAQDVLLTARLDIDLTTFNLVFRRFMLTDNNLEEWERAQRVFGGFSKTLEQANAELTHPDRVAAGQKIGENAKTMREAAGTIAGMIARLKEIETGPLGADLAALTEGINTDIEALSTSSSNVSVVDGLTFLKAWTGAMKSTQITMRFPTEENLTKSREIFETALAAGQALPFGARLAEPVQASLSALQEYVQISTERDALVVSALNQLGFQTGGIAEEARIAAMQQQTDLMNLAESNVNRMTAQSFLLLILTVAAGSILAIFISRSIARPLANIKCAMSSLSSGSLSTQIPETQREDEIGQMAQATEVFKNNLLKTQALEKEASEQEIRQREAAKEKQLELVSSFEDAMSCVITDLRGSAGSMVDLSHGLKGNADTTVDRSVTMAAAAEEASANVSTVAAAVEEMASALTSMTESVNDVAKRANNATHGAKEAEEDLDALQSSIGEISAVVESINSVADQTNLLALNATIEAARAGEAGKGFAVVASEVKALADQTRKMTDVISERVHAVEKTSAFAIEKTRNIVDQIQDIDHTIMEITETVQQQDSATNEISRAAQEASIGSTNVSSDIQTVQQAAQSMNTTSTEVGQSADKISDNVATVEAQMKEIVASVRNG